MRTRTPQEKKKLSLQRDRRNVYGENSKASRKAIPLRKRLLNRAERHARNTAVAVAVATVDAQNMDPAPQRLRATTHRTWQKKPDMPLGQFLRRKRRPSLGR